MCACAAAPSYHTICMDKWKMRAAVVVCRVMMLSWSYAYNMYDKRVLVVVRLDKRDEVCSVAVVACSKLLLALLGAPVTMCCLLLLLLSTRFTRFRSARRLLGLHWRFFRTIKLLLSCASSYSTFVI